MKVKGAVDEWKIIGWDSDQVCRIDEFVPVHGEATIMWTVLQVAHTKAFILLALPVPVKQKHDGIICGPAIAFACRFRLDHYVLWLRKTAQLIQIQND